MTGTGRHGAAIVVASFHKDEADRMLSQATNDIEASGLDLISVVRVPGAYEIPLATKRLLFRDDINAVIVLGIIERGQTSHGRVMGQTVSDALVDLQLEFMKPIGIGILGPDIDPALFEPRLAKHARAAVEAVVSMMNDSTGS